MTLKKKIVEMSQMTLSDPKFDLTNSLDTLKDIRNLFRLKKELNYTAIKDKRNVFRQEKEKNLFEHEEEQDENHYKPVIVSFGVTIILNM